MIRDIENKLSVLEGIRYEHDKKYLDGEIYSFKRKSKYKGMTKIFTDNEGNFIVKSDGQVTELENVLIIGNGYCKSKEYTKFNNYVLSPLGLVYSTDNVVKVIDKKGNEVKSIEGYCDIVLTDSGFVLRHKDMSFVSFFDTHFTKIGEAKGYDFCTETKEITYKYITLKNVESGLINIFDFKGNKKLKYEVQSVILDTYNETIITSNRSNFSGFDICLYTQDVTKIVERNISSEEIKEYKGFTIDKDFLIFKTMSIFGSGYGYISYSKNEDVTGLDFENFNELRNEKNYSYTIFQICSDNKLRKVHDLVCGRFMLATDNKDKKGIIDSSFNLLLKVIYDKIRVLDTVKNYFVVVNQGKHSVFLAESKKLIELNADSIIEYKQNIEMLSYRVGTAIKSIKISNV